MLYPKVSPQTLTKWSKQIVPLWAAHPNQLWHIKRPKNIFTDVYTYNPTLAHPAAQLQEKMRIRTYHAGHYFFRPTIAEVLRSIPYPLRKRVNAFYIAGITDRHVYGPNEYGHYTSHFSAEAILYWEDH